MVNQVDVLIGSKASFHGEIMNLSALINDQPIIFSEDSKSIHWYTLIKDIFFFDGRKVASKKGARFLAQFLDLKHLDAKINIQNGKILSGDKDQYKIVECEKIDQEIDLEKIFKKTFKKNFWIRLAMQSIKFHNLND